MDENSRNESHRLMEKYNFDSPIKVTIVVEEDQPEDTHPCSTCHYQASESTSSPMNNLTNQFNTSKANDNTENVSLLKDMLKSGDQNAQRNNAQQKSDFPWRLLNPIIDNLIHISKYHYHNIMNVDKQREDYKKLNSQYLLFKHHFFNLSYSTTVAVLLPQANNKKFILSFIERIIQIASHFLWYEVTFDRLYTLVQDLLNWTKQKKIYIETKFGLSNYTANNCHPSVVSRVPAPPDTLTQQVIGGNNSNIKVTSEPKKNPINNLRESQTQTNNSFIPRSFHPTQENNIPSNIRNTSNVNNVNKKILLSSGPPNREITISIDQQILDSLNNQNPTKTMNRASQTQANGNYQIKRRKPNNRHVQNYPNVTHTPNARSHYQNRNGAANNLINVTDSNSYELITESNHINSGAIRSISRDSGCFSPNRTPFPDVDLNVTFEEMHPIISHVTSTNPNAVNIRKGNCKICRTVTNNMCVGCYQQYYCSSSCQRKDWQIHQRFCNTR